MPFSDACPAVNKYFAECVNSNPPQMVHTNKKYVK